MIELAKKLQERLEMIESHIKPEHENTPLQNWWIGRRDELIMVIDVLGLSEK